MALAIGGTDICFKKTGQLVTVPNNPKARLMFYLDCICHALEMNSEDTRGIQKLRDYKNYFLLTQEETIQLFVVCGMISPDILLNKVIFQIDDLCGDCQNEFYEIAAVRNMLVASSSIVIGGRTRRVNKIMTFKMIWLEKNYLEPMTALKDEIEAARERQRRRDAQSRCNII